MRNGQVFEHPMPERPTTGTESLFLPTVMANSPMRNSRRSMVTHPDKRSGVALNQALELMAGVLPSEFESWDEVPQNYQRFRPVKGPSKEQQVGKTQIKLLPTPVAVVYERTLAQVENRLETRPKYDQNLDEKVFMLLRTPTAAEVEGGPVSPEVAKAKGQTLRLTGQVLSLTEWGEFEPAIQRWEDVTGNDAPEPTLADGQKGQHRLNSRFTEWMMGLAPGWITGHELSRRDEIKMAGNGVVPQQAVFALSVLLERLEK
jgi:hypothetical protein